MRLSSPSEDQLLRVKGCQLSGLDFHSEAVEEVAAGTEKRQASTSPGTSANVKGYRSPESCFLLVQGHEDHPESHPEPGPSPLEPDLVHLEMQQLLGEQGCA